MKPTYTTQNVLRMILDDLRGSHMFSDDFIIFSVSQVVLPKKHLKVPEFCRSDFGYFWLFFKSAGAYCTTSGGPVRSPEKSGSLINWHI